MIQLAIISDIHANIIAFKAVLKDIEKKKITQVFCLGDLVDFAPWGNQVIALMQSRNIPCILGNHDERIAFNQPIIPLAHHDEIETLNRIRAINFSKKIITNHNKNWLAQRPYQLELSYKTANTVKNILLVHASPRSNDEYIYESYPKQNLINMLRHKDIDALVMGHTHTSYIQHHSNILIVNSGSVGRSREEDRKATYTILSISDNSITAEIIKVNYRINFVAEAIYQSEIPNFYADFLLKR